MATNDDLFQVTMHASNVESSAFASLDENNDQLVANFDDSTEERLLFGPFFRPRKYEGNGWTLRLMWTTATGNSGNVVWGAEARRLQDDDASNDLAGTYDTQRTVTGDAPSAAGEVVYDEIDLGDADLDGVLEGEAVQIRISREAANGSDTLTGDAQLIAIEIYET